MVARLYLESPRDLKSDTELALLASGLGDLQQGLTKVFELYINQ